MHPVVMSLLQGLPSNVEDERQAYIEKYANEHALVRTDNGVIGRGREIIVVQLPDGEWMWTPADGLPFDTKH